MADVANFTCSVCGAGSDKHHACDNGHNWFFPFACTQAQRPLDLCRQESASSKAGNRWQSKHNLECKTEHKMDKLSWNYPRDGGNYEPHFLHWSQNSDKSCWCRWLCITWCTHLFQNLKSLTAPEILSQGCTSTFNLKALIFTLIKISCTGFLFLKIHSCPLKCYDCSVLFLYKSLPVWMITCHYCVNSLGSKEFKKVDFFISDICIHVDYANSFLCKLPLAN